MIKDDFNLVLSGGAALGYVHVGVVERLYELSLEPREIVGTSMGAIVGAVFALGLSRERFVEIFDEFSSIHKWLRLSFTEASIVDADKIDGILEGIFGDKKMCDTKIPLRIIASDFDTGNMRIFCKDDNIYIRDAVRASMAVPGIFPQVEIEGRYYVDGYLCANLPIGQVSDSSIDTLAIDVMGRNSIERYIKEEESFFGQTKSILRIVERTVRLMMINQTKTAIELYHGNLIRLEPKLNEYKATNFNKYQEIREIGYEMMRDEFR